eukprot:TRINITY_DN52329_c0_g1_i1.p1 TRINITY_DN52329_c0_g1~~TRINITY_DN52329_c0_g1_i1.p1  ORF type:complete len:430 (-),score=49.29 TRINITY_DN52329_c0_g1_i1:960-2249(-)
MSTPVVQDINDPKVVQQQMQNIFNFYHPKCIDKQHGGFIQHWVDDGPGTETTGRHVVHSCRMVMNYCLALKYSFLKKDEALSAIEHGLQYLDRHKLPNGLYSWMSDDGKVVDASVRCYGYSFLLQAYGMAWDAGVSAAKEIVTRIWNDMEDLFWEPTYKLYADEVQTKDNPEQADRKAYTKSCYRGQNSNMHCAEACLLLWEIFQDKKYLDRAETVITKFTKTLSSELATPPGGEGSVQGLVWEHWTMEWKPDMQYNHENPNDIFKPWGYMTGHQGQWSQLLLVLHEFTCKTDPDRESGCQWMVERAENLFKAACDIGWDEKHGGFVYGFAPDKKWCADTKMFWVQAELMATAMMLGVLTNKPEYQEWAKRIWVYCWNCFIDHTHGAWWCSLSCDNTRIPGPKSPVGLKSDYHSLFGLHKVQQALLKKH